MITFYLGSTSICIIIAIATMIEVNTSEKAIMLVDYALRNHVERKPQKLVVLLVPLVNILVGIGLLFILFMTTEQLRNLLNDE